MYVVVEWRDGVGEYGCIEGGCLGVCDQSVCLELCLGCLCPEWELFGGALCLGASFVSCRD